MKRTPFITLLSLALTGASLLAEEKPPTHLKVGDPVPKVVLQDADGGKHDLRDHIAKKPAVLIF